MIVVTACYVGGTRGSGIVSMRGLGFTSPVGTGGVLDVCLCLDCVCVGGVL